MEQLNANPTTPAITEQQHPGEIKKKSEDIPGTIATRALKQEEVASPEKGLSASPGTSAHQVTSREDTIDRPSSTTLNKVEQFVLKWLAKVFPSFKNEFDKERVNQARLGVTESKARTQKHAEFKEYTPNLDNASDLQNISVDLLLDPKGMQKTFKSNAAVARQAVEQETFKNLKSMQTSLGTMIPYSFETKDGEIQMQTGQVTPTSYVLGSDEAEKQEHLTNTYAILVEGKQYAVIRSGKIDTQQRADEFVALLSSIHKDIVNKTGNAHFKLRVVSQQLNSFETEGKLIDVQHHWISAANKKLQEKRIGEVLHINTPSNRFYQFTKAIRHFGPFGALIEKRFLKGEALSLEQNIDSWSTYTKWLAQDVGKFLVDRQGSNQGELPETLKKPLENWLSSTIEHDSERAELQSKIDQQVKTINDLKTKLANAPSEKEKKNYQQQLSEHNTAIKQIEDKIQARANEKLKDLQVKLDKYLSTGRTIVKKLEGSSETEKANDEQQLSELDASIKVVKDQIQAVHEELRTGISQKLKDLQIEKEKHLDAIGEIKEKLAKFPPKTPKKEKEAYHEELSKHEILIAEIEGQIKEERNSDPLKAEKEKHLEAIFDIKTKLGASLTKEEKSEVKQQLSIISKELHEARNKMKEYLINDYENLKAIEAELIKIEKRERKGNVWTENVSLMHQKVSLMREVLGTQLGVAVVPRHDRGKEGMAIQLLNDLLGVTSAMNCKSGLDRTGFWHAIKLAMGNVIKNLGRDASFSLVQGWETKSRQVNQLINQMGIEKFNKWIQTEGSSEADEELKTDFKHIVEFRKSILSNMIRMGIPITIASTGLAGFKWHKGMQENLIPLNFLPPFVQVNGRAIQLVIYDNNGRPTGMTSSGRQLLTKFQSYRGS